MSSKIGLFYGSSTCYTEMVAEKIQALLGKERVDVFNIATTPLNTCASYDFLIFGIPTWDYGELQEDWDNRWDELDSLDLTGKTAAIFGLGDQKGYPQWFQDALGYLFYKLKERGAHLIGFWPNQGYTFESSKGLTEDHKHFLGLSLDEENQSHLTDDRLKRWLQTLGLQLF